MNYRETPFWSSFSWCHDLFEEEWRTALAAELLVIKFCGGIVFFGTESEIGAGFGCFGQYRGQEFSTLFIAFSSLV